MQNSCLLTVSLTLCQLFQLSALHCCNMLFNSLVNCMGICTEDKQQLKEKYKKSVLGCHLNLGSALSDINFKYFFLKFGFFFFYFNILFIHFRKYSSHLDCVTYIFDLLMVCFACCRNEEFAIPVKQ